jgi:large conductance mechanosensitive channel
LAKKRIKVASEFKDFILRGNVIDLAVGVIIGGAFGKIVTSLVNDIVMPLFSLLIGTGQFANMFIALDGNDYSSLDAAVEASAPVLKYGNFIAMILDFVLMALVIFMLVKFIAFLRKGFEKEKPQAAPATKVCPFCMSAIHIDASVCPMCTRSLNPKADTDNDTEGRTMLFNEVG